MCGIAGIIGNYDQSDKYKISKTMKHRGPDGVGFFDGENFCFIHSLLKIMDLSDSSIQPMIDKDTGNVIIFNGSIYNYKNLRNKFFSNISLKSNTDTEVLLNLYRKFGIEFIKHIKGMFSIALFDKKLNKVYIIRDRFGIKPLFYFSDSEYFIFASEIKILLSHRNVKKSLNLDVDEVLKFIGHRQLLGFKKTLLKNIKILEPNNYIEINLSNKKFKVENYNNELDKLVLKEDCDNLIFENKFDESVGYHTITEHKKIACLLSGGIDSGLLSVVLNAKSEEKEVHTFSSILNEPNIENKNIPRLVKENNFIHHYLHEDSINFFEDHLKTIKDMDQPTPDAATTIHNALCKEVSKNGFKVLFSGNGGDEHFFGYPLHIYGYLADALSKKKLNEFFSRIKQIHKYSDNKYLISKSLKEIINIKLINKYKKYQLSKRINHLDVNNHYKEIKFYENLSDEIFVNIIRNYNTHWGMQSFLDYEDKNSMAYGVECRVPYLDYDLADISFKTSLKKHFEIGTKSLLRKHSKMPNYLRDAKTKEGFAANLGGYVDKNINKIKEKIYYDFKDVPLINVDKLIDLYKNKKDKDYTIFFRTYSYGVWYKTIFK